MHASPMFLNFFAKFFILLTSFTSHKITGSLDQFRSSSKCPSFSNQWKHYINSHFWFTRTGNVGGLPLYLHSINLETNNWCSLSLCRTRLQVTDLFSLIFYSTRLKKAKQRETTLWHTVANWTLSRSIYKFVSGSIAYANTFSKQ